MDDVTTEPFDPARMRRECLDLLGPWADAAEEAWWTPPGMPGAGCYGSGFVPWGVQTNQKYAGAMVVLAALRPDSEFYLRRAIEALRFSNASHLSGAGRCADGRQWGHTWISVLGLERMMNGFHLIWDRLGGEDRRDLLRVIASEADWLLHDYGRGSHKGIRCSVWNAEGANHPESSVWNGAFLWRAAALLPGHPNASAWRERAHDFFINAVSIAADAGDDSPAAGKTVRERHVGANFFPNYALDHHGYLNVGYMVMCLSNAAVLHFDARLAGFDPPETLYHHQRDLWRVVRRMVFADGRLARLGGDTRVRYAYCQEYLLPSLLFAADRFGDPHAGGLAMKQIAMMRAEAEAGGDGLFFSRRLAEMRATNPYYYPRLESDRASALGMAAAYADLVEAPREATESFEASVAGGWCEPEHGAVLHRCPTRLASFAWRAHGLMQGLCQPPDDGHFAEWERNLAGGVDFLNLPHPVKGGAPGIRRRLENHHIAEFPGGFATAGTVMEGVDVVIAEGWKGTDLGAHHLLFVALPDGHTVVGLQFCRTADKRAYTASVKGLQWNVPNDLFNGFQRLLTTAGGPEILTSPPRSGEIVSLGPWVNVADRIGAVALYGADRDLSLHRAPQRRGGGYRSLHTEQVCLTLHEGMRGWDPNSTVLDAGWAVLASADAQATRQFESNNRRARLETGPGDARSVVVRALDGKTYWICVNFGSEGIELRPAEAGLPQSFKPHWLAAPQSQRPGEEGVLFLESMGFAVAVNPP